MRELGIGRMRTFDIRMHTGRCQALDFTGLPETAIEAVVLVDTGMSR